MASGLTPFKLVYGLETVLPMEFVIPSLQIVVVHRLSLEDSIPSRLDQIFHLDEAQISSLYIASVVQHQRQAWVNRQVKFRVFKPNSKLGLHPSLSCAMLALIEFFMISVRVPFVWWIIMVLKSCSLLTDFV